MFEKFTDRAKKVMALANQEAQRCNHEYVDTGHILIALLKEGSGLAAFVLKKLGADLSEMRSGLEEIDKPGPAPQAKKALEYAVEEARSLGDNHIGTEHILLGLLRQPEKGNLSTANKILRKLKINPKEVRKEVMKLLKAPTIEQLLKKEGEAVSGEKKERPVKCEIFEERGYLRPLRTTIPVTATMDEEKYSPEKVKAAMNEFLAGIEFVEAQQSSVVVHALPHIIITKYTIYHKDKK